MENFRYIKNKLTYKKYFEFDIKTKVNVHVYNKSDEFKKLIPRGVSLSIFTFFLPELYKRKS